MRLGGDYIAVLRESRQQMPAVSIVYKEECSSLLREWCSRNVGQVVVFETRGRFLRSRKCWPGCGRSCQIQLNVLPQHRTRRKIYLVWTAVLKKLNDLKLLVKNSVSHLLKTSSTFNHMPSTDWQNLLDHHYLNHLYQSHGEQATEINSSTEQLGILDLLHDTIRLSQTPPCQIKHPVANVKMVNR